MTTTTNTAARDNLVENFLSAMGNPVKATQHFAKLVEHAAENKMDTRRICGAIDRQARKGDKEGAAIAAKIVCEVFKGAEKSKAKDGKTTVIKTKGATLDKDALTRLKDAAKGATNFRVGLLKKVKGETTTPKKDAAWVENNATPNLVKSAIAAGLSEAQILGMVRKQFKDQTAVN